MANAESRCSNKLCMLTAIDVPIGTCIERKIARGRRSICLTYTSKAPTMKLTTSSVGRGLSKIFAVKLK
jgi:hypothetical protein